LDHVLKTVDVEQDDRQRAAVSGAPGNLSDEQTAPEIGPIQARFCIDPAEWLWTEYLGLPLSDVIGGHVDSLGPILRIFDSPAK